MAQKKILTDEELLARPFDFENSIRMTGPLDFKKVKKAIKANKILKSVRYDGDLLAQVQDVADTEGIPYQTLMNSLLKAGLEARLGRHEVNDEHIRAIAHEEFQHLFRKYFKGPSVQSHTKSSKRKVAR